jgi:hypothetical protein
MENSHTYTISNIIGIIEHDTIPTQFLVSKKLLTTSFEFDDSIEEYFEQQFIEFQRILNALKTGKYDAIILSNYLTEAKVAKAVLEERQAVYTHNYPSVRESLSSFEMEFYNWKKLEFSLKIDTLNLIINSLNGELSFLKFTSSDESKTEIPLLNTKSNQIINNFGRARFNIGKKESLMLLYILEKSNLLIFENDEQRKKFIEGSFSFTETRNNHNKGNSFPITDIASDISKFKSFAEADSNNKTLEKLLEKLNKSINEFEFK